MPETKHGEKIINGISASPGICIGKAYLVDKEGVDVVEKYRIRTDDIQQEVKRFKTAVKKAGDDLIDLIEETPEAFHTNILETQQVMLRDKMLYGRTLETIENEGVNAEWALKKVVSEVKSVFQGMANAYLKERASDIVHLSERIMRNLVGAEQVNIGNIDKRVILVAKDLSPAETSQINLERIKGFVTDKGGKASHTGIIARTLELPAVLGLGNATALIHNDDVIIVDGISGLVIISPSENTLMDYEERKINFETRLASITRSSRLPAKTTDGHHLKVMGNIELPEEVVQVINYGGEGIGLYRTEFQYMSRQMFPNEDELFEKYNDVVEVLAPKPVTIRTLDINGDKALSPENGATEVNPALGLRGIRYCLQRQDVFMTQLRAILRAAVNGSVRIMFPMICNLAEVIESKRLLGEAAESLDREGIPYNCDIQIGVLVEVPSAVVIADHLAEVVDFFSIGTNDLIQYALAIDRGNRQVNHLFRPLDPAVLRLIKQVCDVARQKKIKVFMCGEMAGYPIHLPVLLGLGLDELSMNPQSMPVVKRMTRSLNLSQCRDLMPEVMQQKSAEDVYHLLQTHYGEILAEVEMGE